MFDADDDKSCDLGPELLKLIHDERRHIDVACVIADPEYETWLVAGAEGLREYLKPEFATAVPADADQARVGKGWIQQFFSGSKYSETVDQPRMTARFALPEARQRSRSFDKLCRDLARLCG
jgi:hypothetical protein